MKALILAGGYGSRLGEETVSIPKPMLKVGEKPILWHIMKIYSNYGINEFVICLGYKGYIIKEYFKNYFLHNSDVEVNLENDTLKILSSNVEPWKITLVETGTDTMTGGRIKIASKYLGDAPFLMTYGDGVSDLNIHKLIQNHKDSGKLITLTAVHPAGRYGALELNETSTVIKFAEKPSGEGSWMNGGFFVCEPNVINYINGDQTSFEDEPLEKLAKDGQLNAYKHRGFWQCMDTARDRSVLNSLWETDNPPWKTWQ